MELSAPAPETGAYARVGTVAAAPGVQHSLSAVRKQGPVCLVRAVPSVRTV